MSIPDIDKLETLSYSKQLVFAYLTCERLYPNYVYFSDSYDFGNPSALREAISFLYDNLFENHITSPKIDSLIRKVEENVPGTEDFATIFVSSALDVCTCILDSLNFLISKDFEKVKSISSYGLDSVDMYIRTTENIDTFDKDFNYIVSSHPLLLREVSIQQGVMAFLINTNIIDYGDVQTLLSLQENNKKGNLNL